MSAEKGPVKLLLTWDMIQGREQEYFEFLVREFVPGIQSLGIQPTEAWFTTYGSGPQMVTGGVADDFRSMQRALSSKEWEELSERLQGYVSNFTLKVVRATGGFQI